MISPADGSVDLGVAFCAALQTASAARRTAKRAFGALLLKLALPLRQSRRSNDPLHAVRHRPRCLRPFVMQHALALARTFNAELYVIHAVEPMGQFAESLLQSYLDEQTLDQLHSQG